MSPKLTILYSDFNWTIGGFFIGIAGILLILGLIKWMRGPSELSHGKYAAFWDPLFVFASRMPKWWWCCWGCTCCYCGFCCCLSAYEQPIRYKEFDNKMRQHLGSSESRDFKEFMIPACERVAQINQIRRQKWKAKGKSGEPDNLLDDPFISQYTLRRWHEVNDRRWETEDWEDFKNKIPRGDYSMQMENDRQYRIHNGDMDIGQIQQHNPFYLPENQFNHVDQRYLINNLVQQGVHPMMAGNVGWNGMVQQSQPQPQMNYPVAAWGQQNQQVAPPQYYAGQAFDPNAFPYGQMIDANAYLDASQPMPREQRPNGVAPTTMGGFVKNAYHRTFQRENPPPAVRRNLADQGPRVPPAGLVVGAATGAAGLVSGAAMGAAGAVAGAYSGVSKWMFGRGKKAAEEKPAITPPNQPAEPAKKPSPYQLDGSSSENVGLGDPRSEPRGQTPPPVYRPSPPPPPPPPAYVATPPPPPVVSAMQPKKSQPDMVQRSEPTRSQPVQQPTRRAEPDWREGRTYGGGW